MRVEARDTGKAWRLGTVTCVKGGVRVKLDTELSGCSWDEVRIPDEDAPKPGGGALDDIKQKILEDAQALLKEAKDDALTNLKAAVEGVQLLASLENPSAAAFKEAKMRVATAIKAAQEKGVSQAELIEASSAMGKAKSKDEKVKEEKEKKEKEKKQRLVVEFENAAAGAAGTAAAETAKEEGKTIPEIIKAAIEAAKAVEGVLDEDVKKMKKLAAAIAMEGSSSSSSSSSESEAEPELDAKEAAKIKREAIAAVFYFDALKT